MPHIFCLKFNNFFSQSPKKIIKLELCSKSFSPKMILILYDLKFWFRWMMKLTFPRNYNVKLLDQGFNRQRLTSEENFNRKKYQFFASESWQAEIFKKAFNKYRFRFSEFLILQNYRLDFLHQGSIDRFQPEKNEILLKPTLSNSRAVFSLQL